MLERYTYIYVYEKEIKKKNTRTTHSHRIVVGRSGGGSSDVQLAHTQSFPFLFSTRLSGDTHTHTRTHETHARTPARVTRNRRVCCVIRPITPRVYLPTSSTSYHPSNPIPRRDLRRPVLHVSVSLYVYCVFVFTRSNQSRLPTAPFRFRIGNKAGTS